ncbi:hypothetical protein ABPG72_005249 [Tetrahymena utriculariae]
MPPKPATNTNKPTVSSTAVKPAAQTTQKTGVATQAAQKPSQTVANTTNKSASSVSSKPAINQASKPTQQAAQKPTVASNTTKPVVSNTSVKTNSNLTKAPVNTVIKPGVVNKKGGPQAQNQKLDPAAAKKKEEQEKKLQEEKLKEQQKAEEEAKQKKEEEERKQKEEEEKRIEEEKKKKEEEERKKKEDEERAALELAEKQYKEAKLAEEKRMKEEQEKLKNGKINVKTNTGGLTSTVPFTIKDGIVSYDLVDDELALSFAYEKGYQLFLTVEKDGKPDESVSFFSQGSGKSKTFNNLQAETTYWCVVLKNDAAESKRKVYKVDESSFGGSKTNQKRGEGYSCLYGNPCVDQYVCLDWNNRFTIAKQNLGKKMIKIFFVLIK